MIKGYLPGTFDLFHIGHLNLIKRAKQECDFLIVGVNTDRICVSNKGVSPAIPLDERCAIVEAIRYVDEVVVQDTTDRFQAWEVHKFDVIFVGDDWRGSEKWDALERRLNEVNSRVKYFSYTEGTSSTKLRAFLNNAMA